MNLVLSVKPGWHRLRRMKRKRAMPGIGSEDWSQEVGSCARVLRRSKNEDHLAKDSLGLSSLHQRGAMKAWPGHS